MKLRQAESSEFEAVMALIEDGRAALATLGIDQWQGTSPNAATVRADIAAGHTYVLEASPEDTAYGEEPSPVLLGTLAFITTGEPDYARIRQGAWLTQSPNAPEEGTATYAVVHRMATSAAAHGHGIGTFMLRSTLQLAHEQGLASVRIDTHEGNMPMQRALANAGYTCCCVISITDPGEPTSKRLGYEALL